MKINPDTQREIPIPGLETDQSPSHIVAVETVSDDGVLIYQRMPGKRLSSFRATFRPWLITTNETSRYARLTAEEETLSGAGELRVLKRFSSSALWSDAVRELRRNSADHITFPSRTEQFLVETGFSLFQGMVFEDIRRAQVDIETLGLSPEDPNNAIVIVTATLNGRDPFVAHAGDLTEPDLIETLGEWIRWSDPDVVEGHNFFNFDLPFLARRAARHGLDLQWGRDGSPVRFGSRQRFKAGARTIPYEAAYIRGRHVIDTYQQIQRYDVAGHLSSYGLKQAIEALGLERHDRTHVPGDEIGDIWRKDPDRLLKYAVDDVLDTNLLSELALPTEFYQTQLLPSSLQAVATGGPGEKVNDLLVRAYVRAGTSIPTPRPPSGYPGGYTAVRATGIFGPPVVNADVESLYPSIMISDRISPASDELGVFLPILETLRTERLRAKQIAGTTVGPERARWNGTQASLKVLINSFYGYLGYSRGFFNDYSAAERVTRRGHEVIQKVEELLEEAGATIVEIDTDGIYFVPPAHQGDTDQIDALIDQVSDQIGEGIRLSVDGVWETMLSLKLKNYALLDKNGALTVKGSSLRSRRDEPFLREFLTQAILGYLSPASDKLPRDLYFDVAQRIIESNFAPEEISRQESITDRTFTSDANRRLARVVKGERVGERVTVYQRRDGELQRIENYAGDEDQTYLLQRLRAMAERFRPLYNDGGSFEHTYPVITVTSDLETVAAQERVTQRSLFDL